MTFQRYYTNIRYLSLSVIRAIENGPGLTDDYLTNDTTEFLKVGKEQLISRMADVDTIINLEHDNEKNI